MSITTAGVNPRTDSPHPRPGPHVGAIMVTRGRHAGKRLADCPDDFLQWLAERSTSPVFREAAAELLAIRGSASPAPQGEGPPARPQIDLTAYAADPGAYVLDFGQHKGFRLDDVPDAYLAWIAAESWHHDLRDLARAVIADRQAEALRDPFQVAPPSDERAADVLPRLAFDFEQRLRAEFGDDVFTVERAIALLRELATTYTGRRPATEQELIEATEGR
jgi:uncharacterized protein (DUF3820 family)